MFRLKFTLRGGFTLVELATVVAILAIIAVFAAPRVAGFALRAKIVAAERQLSSIDDAFTSVDGGYIADMRGIPGFSLSYLRVANLLISTNLYGEVIDGSARMKGFRVDEEGLSVKGLAKRSEFVRWNDELRRGWRGPYLKNVAGIFPDRGFRRFNGDATSAERGFYPEVDNLRIPGVFMDDGLHFAGQIRLHRGGPVLPLTHIQQLKKLPLLLGEADVGHSVCFVYRVFSAFRAAVSSRARRSRRAIIGKTR